MGRGRRARVPAEDAVDHDEEVVRRVRGDGVAPDVDAAGDGLLGAHRRRAAILAAHGRRRVGSRSRGKGKGSRVVEKRERGRTDGRTDGRMEASAWSEPAWILMRAGNRRPDPDGGGGTKATRPGVRDGWVVFAPHPDAAINRAIGEAIELTRPRVAPEASGSFPKWQQFGRLVVGSVWKKEKKRWPATRRTRCEVSSVSAGQARRTGTGKDEEQDAGRNAAAGLPTSRGSWSWA